jgi:hypothetical protein
MIKVRKCTDKEKEKTPNMDYVIYFGGAKRLFTKNAIIELENELKKLQVVGAIKNEAVVCECEFVLVKDGYNNIYKKCKKCEKTVS